MLGRVAKFFKGAKMPEMPESVSTLLGCLAIAASVLYVGRDRSVAFEGVAHLGRREDELSKKVAEMQKCIDNLNKAPNKNK